MHSLGCTVEEALLAETEGVSVRLARDGIVDVPVIAAGALLARLVVRMRLNVH